MNTSEAWLEVTNRLRSKKELGFSPFICNTLCDFRDVMLISPEQFEYMSETIEQCLSLRNKESVLFSTKEVTSMYDIRIELCEAFARGKQPTMSLLQSLLSKYGYDRTN